MFTVSDYSLDRRDDIYVHTQPGSSGVVEAEGTHLLRWLPNRGGSGLPAAL